MAHAAENDHHHQHAGLVPLQHRGAGETVQINQQHTGQPRQRPRDGEGHEFVAVHRETDGDHAGFVLADGLQRVAEAGVEQALHAPEHQHKQHQHHEVEDAVVRQVHSRQQRGARCQRQAVVTAIGFDRHSDVVQHLCERQGDHDEVDTLGAQADGADGQRKQTAGQHRQGPGQPGGRDAMEHQDADGVGPHAQVGSMAEADHAAKAQDQVQADRRQSEDQDAGGHTDVELLPAGLGHKGQCDQQGQQHTGAAPVHGVVQQAGGRGLGRGGGGENGLCHVLIHARGTGPGVCRTARRPSARRSGSTRWRRPHWPPRRGQRAPPAAWAPACARWCPPPPPAASP